MNVNNLGPRVFLSVCMRAAAFRGRFWLYYIQYKRIKDADDGRQEIHAGKARSVFFFKVVFRPTKALPGSAAQQS
jgi:hypothetical protein